MPETSFPVLALDVGGTHIRMGIVDGRNRVLHAQRIEVRLADLPPHVDANHTVVCILAEHIADIMNRHPEIAAVGAGFPGFIHRGVVRASPNIPGIRDLPLAERLRERLGVPVSVENDATAAALGESRHGEGAPLAFLLHLTLGTGVGGGIVLDGTPCVGACGMAGEIGHLCVQPGGRRCGCGNLGCLEAYASATSVAARWNEARGGKQARRVDARVVHRHALHGDPLARRILEEAGHALGLAVAQAANLLDVHHVRIGGGMRHAWDMLAGPVQEALDNHLIPPLKGKVHVQPSHLGENAALLGAAWMARNLARMGRDTPQR